MRRIYQATIVGTIVAYLCLSELAKTMNFVIDKNKLLDLLIFKVEESLSRAKRARETSQKDANEAPGAMISRYDSAKEESQYLAGAQKQREIVIERGLAALILLQRELSKYPQSNTAVIGALLIIESESKQSYVFLAPYGGGTIVRCCEEDILVITRESPFGSVLWGMEEGDYATLKKGIYIQEFEILKIY